MRFPLAKYDREALEEFNSQRLEEIVEYEDLYTEETVNLAIDVLLDRFLP